MTKKKKKISKNMRVYAKATHCPSYINFPKAVWERLTHYRYHLDHIPTETDLIVEAITEYLDDRGYIQKEVTLPKKR